MEKGPSKDWWIREAERLISLRYGFLMISALFFPATRQWYLCGVTPAAEIWAFPKKYFKTLCAQGFGRDTFWYIVVERPIHVCPTAHHPTIYLMVTSQPALFAHSVINSNYRPTWRILCQSTEKPNRWVTSKCLGEILCSTQVTHAASTLYLRLWTSEFLVSVYPMFLTYEMFTLFNIT